MRFWYQQSARHHGAILLEYMQRAFYRRPSCELADAQLFKAWKMKNNVDEALKSHMRELEEFYFEPAQKRSEVEDLRSGSAQARICF